MGKRNVLLLIFLLIVEGCVGYFISDQFLKKNVIEEYWLRATDAGDILTEDYARQKLGIEETPSSGDSGQMPALYKGGDTGTGTRVLIADAAASSCLNDNENYSAYAAIDGDTATSWQEGEDGAGEGSWLRFRLQQTYNVSYITFNLGSWRDAESYLENNRPASVNLTIGDQTWKVEFPDEQAQYRFELAEPIAADVVQLELLSVYSGSGQDDTCISEVGIYYSDINIE